MLKSIYQEIIPEADEGLGKKLEKISPLIFDYNSFLVDKLDLPKLIRKKGKLHKKNVSNPLKVAYHDPCHLKNTQGITDAPRDLLRAVPDIEFIDKPPGECCGMGGSFSLYHYDTSIKILEKRIDAINKNEPDVITTGCTGCLMQFMDAVHQNKIDARIIHPAEIIASCLG